MKNKVLIELIVPIIEEKYDIYSKDEYNNLYNGLTGEYYNRDSLVRDTDIRNGSKLILI